MRQSVWVLSALLCGAIALGAAAACSDDGPAGPGEPQLAFTITAPREIADDKALVEVIVQIDAVSDIEYPLRVRFEKANAGQPFLLEGEKILATSAESRTTLRIPVTQDPRIRVTVTESSATGFSVSKTIQIDVLDFP